MQTWFRYTLAFFALVLVLTGFIYVLGPSSTREAVRSGEMQTGQILDPDHTLTSKGEAKVSPDTTSGTTTPNESATLKSNHGIDKSGTETR